MHLVAVPTSPQNANQLMFVCRQLIYLKWPNWQEEQLFSKKKNMRENDSKLMKLLSKPGIVSKSSSDISMSMLSVLSRPLWFLDGDRFCEAENI